MRSVEYSGHALVKIPLKCIANKLQNPRHVENSDQSKNVQLKTGLKSLA